MCVACAGNEYRKFLDHAEGRTVIEQRMASAPSEARILQEKGEKGKDSVPICENCGSHLTYPTTKRFIVHSLGIMEAAITPKQHYDLKVAADAT